MNEKMWFPEQVKRKPWSFFVALAILIGVVAWRYVGVLMEQMPPCMFRAVTGKLCAGCGARRSLAALAGGDVLLALRMNALIYVIGVFLATVAMRLVAHEWRKNQLPVHRSMWMMVWVIVPTVLLFWLLRNVPHWPFNLLAPPSVSITR